MVIKFQCPFHPLNKVVLRIQKWRSKKNVIRKVAHPSLFASEAASSCVHLWLKYWQGQNELIWIHWRLAVFAPYYFRRTSNSATFSIKYSSQLCFILIMSNTTCRSLWLHFPMLNEFGKVVLRCLSNCSCIGHGLFCKNNRSNRVYFLTVKFSCEINNLYFWLHFRTHNSFSFVSSNFSCIEELMLSFSGKHSIFGNTVNIANAYIWEI